MFLRNNGRSCFAILCVLLMVSPGCIPHAGVRQLSGTYVHPESGGVIIFRPNGEFYYSFSTPSQGLPQNIGYYHFTDSGNTEFSLQVRSAHSGLFSLRLSASGNRVFLNYPALFSGEQIYEKQ